MYNFQNMMLPFLAYHEGRMAALEGQDKHSCPLNEEMAHAWKEGYASEQKEENDDRDQIF